MYRFQLCLLSSLVPLTIVFKREYETDWLILNQLTWFSKLKATFSSAWDSTKFQKYPNSLYPCHDGKHLDWEGSFSSVAHTQYRQHAVGTHFTNI